MSAIGDRLIANAVKGASDAALPFVSHILSKLPRGATLRAMALDEYGPTCTFTASCLGADYWVGKAYDGWVCQRHPLPSPVPRFSSLDEAIAAAGLTRETAPDQE